MNKVVAAILVLIVMQVELAHGIQMASPKSNNMVKICTLQEGEAADAACQAFVQGVADVTAFYGSVHELALPFCLDDELTPADLVVVYREYLAANHELRQFSAAALAVAAFKAAFPCADPAPSP